jgi:hypothetical protein
MESRLVNVRKATFGSWILILCLMGATASEWKSQPIAVPSPVFSASQNRVLAALNTQVFELPSNDSIWSPVQTGTTGPLLAADSFHYFENGIVIKTDSQRLAKFMPFPSEACCSYRIAENAQRFYLSGVGGKVFFSEKTNPGWKTFHPTPKPSEGYRLMPFSGHYLLIGAFDILLSRNRGTTWEGARGLPNESPGSVYFLDSFGGDLFVGFVETGIFRSKDQGQNWSALFPSTSPYLDHDFDGIAVSGDTIWLSGSQGYKLSLGILRSVNSGNSWEWLNQGFPNMAASATGHPANPTEWYPTIGVQYLDGELWTASYNSNGYQPIPYRSSDGGKTWQAITSGLNLENPHYPEKIGNEVRLRGVDGYYAFDRMQSRWILDTLLSPQKISLQHSHGDTVWGQGGGFFQRKISSAGNWEKLFPIRLEGEFHYYPNGTEMIGLSNAPFFRLEHSDDGGRTWSSEKPFLPQARYQNRKIEARGAGIYWPDDSLFTPPKLWNAFDDTVRKIWNWHEGVLVQAGSRLFYAAQSGGTWQAVSLPDSNLVYVVRDNRLTGYSLSNVFTLAIMGSQWETRKVHFPTPQIVNLTKTKDHLIYTYSTSTTVNSGMSSRLGYVSQTGAKSYGAYIPDLKVYDGGSYLFRTNGRTFDTLSFNQFSQFFWAFPGRTSLSRPAANNTRALFADGDKMVTAHENGQILYSKDRGKTWSGAVSLPNISEFAGNVGMLFAVSDSSLYHLVDTGIIWNASSVLVSKVKKVSGTPSFLAIITEDNQVKVSSDTAKTWLTLPILPPGQSVIPSALAVYGNQVFVGTQEYGVFSWGDSNASSIKPGLKPGIEKRSQLIGRSSKYASQKSKGWFRVPEHADQSINAKGQKQRASNPY